MIDKPGPAMPHQNVCVAGSAVYIGDVSVEPHDRRCQSRVGLLRDRVERDGSGQVIERKIQSGARFDQVLYFRVGLGSSQLRIEIDEYDLGYGQPRGASDL